MTLHPTTSLLLALVLGGSCGSDGPVGTTNAKRLWFAGPESDLHLSDTEPTTPF
jgi:hypothetical protein